MILDENTYVDKAEQVINELAKKKDKKGRSTLVTTSKLRNILAMTMDIYNQVSASREEDLSADIKGRIEYLRVRIVYECGRDSGRETPVRDFVENAQILEALKEVNGSRKNFILFAHYLEALVAYRKFKDNDKDM